MDFALIVPAAGSGSRAGRSLPKQFARLLGSTVLRHAVLPFAAMPGCTRIVVVVEPSMEQLARESLVGIERTTFVHGADERQHSIARGLAVLTGDAPIVLVHDAARPCVTAELISRVVDRAGAYGAAVPALRVAETVKRVDDEGVIIETIDRTPLRLIQTPQGFHRDILVRAYDSAMAGGLLGTDDASLVEAIGVPVVTVEGDRANIKITHEADFAMAEMWLRRFNSKT